MVGENWRLVYYQPMDFPHGQSKIPTIGWQSECNFNPPAISQWTRKCPGSVDVSSCDLLDFSHKRYSNTGRYPGNGNRYPPGHEHGYLSACMYRGMHVKALNMNGNLLRGGASTLHCSAKCSASVLRNLHSAPRWRLHPPLLRRVLCLRPPQSAQCSAPPSFAIVLQLLLGFWPSHFARLV